MFKKVNKRVIGENWMDRELKWKREVIMGGREREIIM
jgi:hypothetical protein